MSLMNKTSGQRPVKATAEVAGAAQSASARRSAEGELRTLIAKFAPAHVRLIGAARRCVQEQLPTANELVYEYRSWIVISYSPSEHGYEGVLAIRADAKGVQLYLNHGKELPDPLKLLRGSGSLVRSIELDSASTLARPEVVRLIEAAIARNRVPFARTGRGPMVIRPASAKRKQSKPKAKS